MNLSAVILTKNEEGNIERALRSIAFCDEIVIIDDHSKDRTVEIAERFRAKVLKRKLDGDFAKQRNFVLKEAKGEWVLFIDADEEVTEELAREIQKTISKKHEKTAYYIKRHDFFWGRELRFGEVYMVRRTGLIRLVKRNSGYWIGSVHEVFVTSGLTGLLNSYLNHYPHPKLRDFLSKINTYSTIRAWELVRDGKKTNIISIIVYPFGKFITNYFFRLGFLDGAVGFVYAFFMSFHSFLVRAKVYQYSKLQR